MTFADAVNGCFECAGGFFILPSILRLHREKLVRGVSYVHVAFFSAWGVWNLYFYSALDQPLSFWGGMLLAATNTVWLVQMAYYLRQERLLTPPVALTISASGIAARAQRRDNGDL